MSESSSLGSLKVYKSEIPQKVQKKVESPRGITMLDVESLRLSIWRLIYHALDSTSITHYCESIEFMTGWTENYLIFKPGHLNITLSQQILRYYAPFFRCYGNKQTQLHEHTKVASLLEGYHIQLN